MQARIQYSARLVNNVKAKTCFELTCVYLAKPIRIAAGVLLLLATWGLLHHYKGLALDGELYAFQAMSRLFPDLRHDLYLSGNSQDKYTFFSPIYAALIRGLGLWNASVLLFTACSVAFLAGAWSLARSLWDEDRAWLATATSIVIVCGYGAYGVFSYSETYLTARSMAEAMVIVALALRLSGSHWLSWIIAALSILIHPLMALPGLLLLLSLSVPFVYAVLGALAGVLSALTIASLALHIDSAPHFMTLISGEWLEVVRERSQYLFTQLWRLSDWEGHVTPILTLIIAYVVADDPRVRRLCRCGILIGGSGLAVAVIASSIGPVAILLQGQAWRWFWVTGFISVLTLAPTALRLWKAEGCGSVCATLLVASWVFPPVDGSALAAGALSLWLVRHHVKPPTQRVMQSLAYAMIVAISAWTVANIWSICSNPPVSSSQEPLIIERLRSIYALQVPALIIAWLGHQWLRAIVNICASLATVLLLCAFCWLIFKDAFLNNSAIGIAADMKSLSPWRNAIPATSNVLILPGTKSAATIWFGLQRPSYLTVSQSAGVVFSRETALEVRRRSQVLQPVMDPDWKIMTQLANAGKPSAAQIKDKAQGNSLTAMQLTSICQDHELGFVIANDRLRFDGIQIVEPGRWKGWNLYDCRQVRMGSVG